MKTLPKFKISAQKTIFPFVDRTSKNPSSIVILDPTVPDRQHIVQGIKPGTATYILKTQPDAVEQITTILDRHQGI